MGIDRIGMNLPLKRFNPANPEILKILILTIQPIPVAIPKTNSAGWMSMRPRKLMPKA